MDGILMNEDQIRQIAGKQRMPIGTIEKDYALTIILAKLSEADFAEELVFKGGTAIKKAYFSEARFSEDLDFTCLTKTAPKKIEHFLEKEISTNKIECIQFNKTIKTSQKQNSVKIKQTYADISGHPQSINFDLSLREKVLLPTQKRQLTEAYDQPRSKVNAMDLTEIMAEKIRALTTRSLPRDLYDIWFLSKKDVKIDYSITKQKMAYYKEKASQKQPAEIIKQIETTWKRDLDRLIRPVPEYNKLAEETTKILEKIKDL